MFKYELKPPTTVKMKHWTLGPRSLNHSNIFKNTEVKINQNKIKELWRKARFKTTEVKPGLSFCFVYTYPSAIARGKKVCILIMKSSSVISGPEISHSSQEKLHMGDYATYWGKKERVLVLSNQPFKESAISNSMVHGDVSQLSE